MRIGYWIYFNPGEKAQLIQIMNSFNEEYKQIEVIQNTFKVDILTASRVVEVYNTEIKK